MSQREKSNSEEIARPHPLKDSLLLLPLPARAKREPQGESFLFFGEYLSINALSLMLSILAPHYYQPTPPPETVVVHSIPKKTNDACCWGWYVQIKFTSGGYSIDFFLSVSAAALCLCFGLKECCS